MSTFNIILACRLSGYRLFAISKLLPFIERFAKIQTIRYHSVWIRPISSDSTIVDIGANKGDFAEYFFEKNQGSIYCVEPNPQLAEHIKNSSLVDISNIAITESTGEFDFRISANLEASSLSSKMAEIWGDTEVIKIHGKTFDDFIKMKSIDKVSLLKIDVEGAEIDILNNLSSNAFKIIDQITVEFHDFLDPALLPAVEKVIRRLEDNGFVCINFDRSFHENVLFIDKNILKSWRYWKDYMLLKTLKFLLSLSSKDYKRFNSLNRLMKNSSSLENC